MTDQDRYRDAASHALAGFQLIEASLKDYIADYHDRVRISIPSNMTYEYSGKDIEDAALGRLVSTFDKTNSNKSLVRKLQDLRRRRDDLAHRALVNLYGPAQDGFDFQGQTKHLTELCVELGELLTELLKEHAKVFAVASGAA